MTTDEKTPRISNLIHSSKKGSVGEECAQSMSTETSVELRQHPQQDNHSHPRISGRSILRHTPTHFVSSVSCTPLAVGRGVRGSTNRVGNGIWHLSKELSPGVVADSVSPLSRVMSLGTGCNSCGKSSVSAINLQPKFHLRNDAHGATSSETDNTGALSARAEQAATRQGDATAAFMTIAVGRSPPPSLKFPSPPPSLRTCLSSPLFGACDSDNMLLDVPTNVTETHRLGMMRPSAPLRKKRRTSKTLRNYNTKQRSRSVCSCNYGTDESVERSDMSLDFNPETYVTSATELGAAEEVDNHDLDQTAMLPPAPKPSSKYTDGLLSLDFVDPITYNGNSCRHDNDLHYHHEDHPSSTKTTAATVFEAPTGANNNELGPSSISSKAGKKEQQQHDAGRATIASPSFVNPSMQALEWTLSSNLSEQHFRTPVNSCGNLNGESHESINDNRSFMRDQAATSFTYHQLGASSAHMFSMRCSSVLLPSPNQNDIKSNDVGSKSRCKRCSGHGFSATMLTTVPTPQQTVRWTLSNLSESDFITPVRPGDKERDRAACVLGDALNLNFKLPRGLRNGGLLLPQIGGGSSEHSRSSSSILKGAGGRWKIGNRHVEAEPARGLDPDPAANWCAQQWACSPPLTPPIEGTYVHSDIMNKPLMRSP